MHIAASLLNTLTKTIYIFVKFEYFCAFEQIFRAKTHARDAISKHIDVHLRICRSIP